MKKLIILTLNIGLLLGQGVLAWANDNDSETFQFFEEEAKVISASRQPVSRNQSPATVYVVTQEDIKNSGALTIWDALRSVPGVDVIQTRADQGEISIRGLNKPLNNRTLILLDGKTIMNAYYDFALYEAIPVTMQEIDRIEVVEGPASAVYGANAINGVVNIITKTPEKFQGGQLSYSGGERNTQMGSFDYGRKDGKLSYKFGTGWRSLNQFATSNEFASQAEKFNAFVGYSPTSDSEWKTSIGVTDLNTQTTAGGAGTTFDKGTSGFARADYRYKKTKLRGFWNRERAALEEFVTLGSARLDSDTYQAEAEQSMSLPLHQEVVFGGTYRRNEARSDTLSNGSLTQDLWAAYLEDKWDFVQKWSLMLSGRLDRHPYTNLNFSPRGSLIFAPIPEQVFRLSAGSSFRNPTLLENSISASPVTPNPDPATNPLFPSVQTTALGNRDLKPERMESIELAHNGQFGKLQTSLVGFHYKIRNIITNTPPQITGLIPPTINVFMSYINSGELSAYGGEFGVNLHLAPGFSSFANYSYQRLKDSPGEQLMSLQSPEHKANAGFLVKKNGLTGNLWFNWVNTTRWVSVLSQPTSAQMSPVNAYFLLNANVGYAFKDRWEGLEVAVTAFNLLNHDHYETLPASDASHTGMYGEIIRSKWMGTLSYKF